MDQRLKAFLVIGTISVIIYVIFLMTSSEKSFVLTASGNRDPTKQKLMVVDQDSGEISFVSKSLQGLNQGVGDREAVISEELSKLRTDLDNWNRDRYNEIVAVHRDFAKNTRVQAIEDDIKKFKKGNSMNALRDTLDKKISNGQRIGIKVINPLGRAFNSNETDEAANARDHWLNDDGCDHQYGHNDKASWCVDNPSGRMYIHKRE